MKTILIVVCIGLLGGLMACRPSAGEESAEGYFSEYRPDPEPTPVTWHDDYSLAMRLAERYDRPILLYFTGSDWSVRCSRWQDWILASPAFTRYAEADLILVKLDFPRELDQSVGLVQQNQTLQSKFEVEEFPTLILVGPDGEEIFRVAGILPEAPQHFVAWLRAGRSDSA